MTALPPDQPPHQPVHQPPPTSESFAPLDPFQSRAMDEAVEVTVDRRGRRRAPKDPGSGGAATIAWIAAILVVGLVAVLQRMPTGPGPDADPDALRPAALELELIGRVFVKLKPEMSGPNLAEIEREARNLQNFVTTPEDQLRLAMLHGELINAGAAREAIDSAVEWGADDPGLSEEAYARLLDDADTLSAIYIDGPGVLPDAARERLIDGHGSFAEIALVYGLDDSDPARAPIVSGGVAVVVGMFALFGLFLVIGLTGLVLLIWFAIRAGTGRVRPRLPAPMAGGSVYLEMLPVFATLFLLLMVGVSALQATGAVSDRGLIVIQLSAQWLLVPCVFAWPVIRGVPLKRALNDLGWTRGDGLVKESLIGLGAWLAAIPLLVGAAILVQILALLMQLMGQEVEPPGSSAVLEMLASGDLVVVMLLVSLTTLWAPILEETVFRGAMLRHLNSRIHWLPAAFLVAIVFAVMHEYPLIVLPVLITLAMVFATLRYWRGTLIPAVVGHFIHNAVATTVLILIAPLLA